MPEVLKHYIIDLPRRGGRHFEGTLAECQAWIRGQSGIKRVGLVFSAVPPDEGCDAAVCVPYTAFGAWDEEATAVTKAWEKKWLLIESMPARHRDEARSDLQCAIASALIAAATNGVDVQGQPDVGF